MLIEASPSLLLLGGGVAAGAFIVHAYLTYRHALNAVGNTPGIRTLVSISRPIMMILPSGKLPFTNWFFSIGPNYWATERYEAFRVHGQDIITGVSVDLFAPAIVVADADAAQEVLGNRARFTKPIEIYSVLDLYGHNIVTTEGEEWRNHRRICAPSFSENNNRLVCEETAVVMESLFETWKGKQTVECNVEELTIASALMVICSAGFGKRVPWVDTTPPSGHELTFKSAIEIVSSDLFVKVAVPDFAMGLTARTSKVQLGFSELHRYILEMIQERTTSYRDHSDLFSNLVAANEKGDHDYRLTNDEMIGNVFMFLIAGHETTAHTLAFAIGLLALYPNIQEKLYQQVVEVVSDPSGTPSYNEVLALTYALAVFYETLRLYPSVTIIPKRSIDNTTLRTTNSRGETVVVPVPKGYFVTVNVPALHTNPKYWKDPEEFQPDRFMGDWPKNAFVPFAMGARACIGRRFSEIEAVTELAMLVRNYRIEIQPDARFVGETPQQRQLRVLALQDILTLAPKRIPIVLTRR